MRRGTLFWGFILILMGVALLLDNMGLLGNIQIWSLLWPLFLISLGIWILLGTVFRRPVAAEHAMVALEGATRGRIKLMHGAGRMDMHAGTGLENILEGDFANGVDIDKQREGDTIAVRLSTPVMFFPFVFEPGALDWHIGLSQHVPLMLEVETGASEVRMDLSELLVGELRLKAGASSTQITLPRSAGSMQVFIEAGAASVNVKVPEGVAARIRARGGITSINVDDNRFQRSGDYYQSSDYESAINKAAIDIQMGAGSMRVY